MNRILIFGAGRDGPVYPVRGLISLPVSQSLALSFTMPVKLDDRRFHTLFSTVLNRLMKRCETAWISLSIFPWQKARPLVAQWCEQHGISLLSGVTGIDSDTHVALDAAAGAAPGVVGAQSQFWRESDGRPDATTGAGNRRQYSGSFDRGNTSRRQKGLAIGNSIVPC